MLLCGGRWEEEKEVVASRLKGCSPFLLLYLLVPNKVPHLPVALQRLGYAGRSTREPTWPTSRVAASRRGPGRGGCLLAPRALPDPEVVSGPARGSPSATF